MAYNCHFKKIQVIILICSFAHEIIKLCIPHPRFVEKANVRHMIGNQKIKMTILLSGNIQWGFCWPTVYDAEPTLAQYWVTVSCLTPR